MNDLAIPLQARVEVTTEDGRQMRNIELMGPFIITDNGLEGYAIAHCATGDEFFPSLTNRSIARLIVASLISRADWSAYNTKDLIPEDCVKRLIYVRTLIREIPTPQH